MPDEFDDLNLPLGDLGSLASDGMPDPLAESPAAAEEEAAPQPKRKKAKRAKKAAEPEVERPRGPRLGLKESLANADLYTVMLAISLAAVLIAVLCLVLEWGSYGFQLNARLGAAAIHAPHVVGIAERVSV